MYTKTGEPIIVDKPPLIANESPEIKYLGGRPNDYTSFERLECDEVGPMWLTTMRKIGRKAEAKIGETTSAEPGEAGEADDMSGPDR